ncbi:MAG: decaprenyl-phosphate phosphoribosyltransferase [Planctomycetota bacterium]|jgi:4-hydroxybenzoate polyprenyltransferase
MKNYLSILRISHWSKNIFVFVALIFGGGLVGPIRDVLSAIGITLAGFFCFSLAASAVYIFNDIIDRKTDILHPEKRNRPIASGAVTLGQAAVISVGCAAAAIVWSYAIVRELAIVIAIYIGLMVLYSLLLKRMMILDCVAISIGFCLRAVAGAVIVGVFISPWLLICTFALCLFLGFGKRRSEMEHLGEDSESFREALAGYTPELLGHMLDVTSGLAVICFLLYAMDERTLQVFGTNNLVYTTPLVLYCIFRFSALIQKGTYSDPVQFILKDLPFQIAFCIWVLSCIGIIYADKLKLSFGNTWAF